MNLLSGLCVAVIFLLSLLGWGRLISIAIFGSVKGDWPFQAAWGVCILTLLGGILNATGLVSVPVNISLVLLGLLLCVFLSRPQGLLVNWRQLELNPQDRFAVGALALVSVGRRREEN